jgi:hypothetical protein
MASKELTIRSVKLYVTSLGNHFMIELARIFAEGFQQCGVDSEIMLDKIPQVDPEPELVQIVVAPHEFFNLFLDTTLKKPEIREVLRSVYMLSGEQPLTHWFEMACDRAKLSKGVFDITEHTAIQFRKRGVFAIHAPLGYASCFEEGIQPDNLPERDTDILFMGSNSIKREGWISQNAKLFNQYNSKIVITRLEKPKFLNTVGFFGNEKRNRLLRSSKILVNIHSEDNAYFEWLRVMMTMANGCLVISETSAYTDPLINGEHLIITDLDQIAEKCRYYLEHEEERIKIVDHAYNFITQEFNTGLLCKGALQELEEHLRTSKKANKMAAATV